MREEGFLRKLKMVEIIAEIKTIVSRLKGGSVFRIIFLLYCIKNFIINDANAINNNPANFKVKLSLLYGMLMDFRK